MLRNTSQQWGSISKFFHWLIAILVVIMLTVGVLLNYLPKELKNFFYSLHKSTGLTVLILMILRLFWREINPIPQLPLQTPDWQVKAARWSHRLLYTVIILMPLSGWTMSTAANKPVNFWWLIPIKLPFIPTNKALASFFANVHFYLACTIVGLVIIHILGAFKHFLINRDHILQRMLPNRFKMIFNKVQEKF